MTLTLQVLLGLTVHLHYSPGPHFVLEQGLRNILDSIVTLNKLLTPDSSFLALPPCLLRHDPLDEHFQAKGPRRSFRRRPTLPTSRSQGQEDSPSVLEPKINPPPLIIFSQVSPAARPKLDPPLPQQPHHFAIERGEIQRPFGAGVERSQERVVAAEVTDDVGCFR